jgi:hypothetical protein
MSALLLAALLAADPGAEPSGAPLLPAPDAETRWHEEQPKRRGPSTFRVQLELTAALGTHGAAQFGGALEVGWLPLRFVRLSALYGGAWIPLLDGYSEQQGVMRMLLGVDGVLPFAWGELFVGLQSGLVHTNASNGQGYCPYCYPYYSTWAWQASARLRTGVDLMPQRFAPLTLGFDFAYELLARQYPDLHWFAAHGRIGLAL